MIQKNQKQKIKFLILVILFIKQTTIPKSLNQKKNSKCQQLSNKNRINYGRKIKYLILVIQFKNRYKITEIEKKLADDDHDKYITTPEFNTLAASVFNARLAPANLVTKTDFDAKLLSLSMVIQVILEIKEEDGKDGTLKKMEHKSIQYFNQ